MGNHHGRQGQGFHGIQGFEHARLGVPRLVLGPRLTLAVIAFDMVQMLRLIVGVGHDNAGVVGPGGVELHTKKLDYLWHRLAGFEQFRVGMVELDFGVVGAAVIGGHHPVQTVALCHQGIHGDGVNRIAAGNGCGGISFHIPAQAVAAVDMVVPCQPGLGAGFFSLRALFRIFMGHGRACQPGQHYQGYQ